MGVRLSNEAPQHRRLLLAFTPHGTTEMDGEMMTEIVFGLKMLAHSSQHQQHKIN